ncbi:MAG: L,D-transpeptidase [Pseudomonadota bacterium]
MTQDKGSGEAIAARSRLAKRAAIALGGAARGASQSAARLGARLSMRIAAALCALTLLAACASAPVETALEAPPPAAAPRPDPVPVRPDWRPHFEDLSNGAILINISKRWLVYWEPGGATSHAFPIAVPMTDELTRTGRTTIVRRRANPDWTATPSMIERNPETPRYIPPGPHNPLGLHALYLGWRYYAIHGTNTPGVIGDRVTAGCFRLFNEDIKWLFDNVPNGVPVLVVQDIEVAPTTRDAIGVSGSPSGRLPPSAQPLSSAPLPLGAGQIEPAQWPANNPAPPSITPSARP